MVVRLARFTAVLLAGLGVAGDARAQQHALPQSAVAGEAGNWLVDVWNVNLGLPHGSISAVARTPDGYLWVGTLNGGLARFNGADFEVFTPENTPEFATIRIQRLLVDREGALWIGLMDGSIVSLRGGRFHFEREGLRMPADWLMDIVAEFPGRKYFSSQEGALWLREERLGKVEWRAIRPEGHGARSRYAADAAGRIWFCPGAGGVQRLEGRGFAPLPPAATAACGVVRDLAVDPTGNLAAATERGLALWNGSAFEPVPAPHDGRLGAAMQVMAAGDGGWWLRHASGFGKWRDARWSVQALVWKTKDEPVSSTPNLLLASGDGGLWCARSGEGVWHISADGEVERLALPTGMLSATASQFIRDVEGNCWLGLRDGGLIRLRPRLVRAESFDGINSLCQDGQGAIWISGQDPKMLKLSGGKREVVELPVDSGRGFTSVTAAADGGLWLSCASAGIWHYGSQKFRKVLGRENFKGTPTIRVLHADRTGRLWMSNPYGLWVLEGDALRSFGSAEGYRAIRMDRVAGASSGRDDPPFAEAIADDAAGNVWFGMAQGELRCFRTGRFESFRPNGMKTWVRFNALLPDADGGLWIGTLGTGLLYFREGVFHRFGNADGLPDDFVSQILDDGGGHLWMLTRKGIARIAKAELHAFFKQRRGNKVTCLNFDRSDGMTSLQGTSGAQPSCWRATDGSLWFTHVGTATVIDPAKLQVNQVPPPVVIEAISIDGVRRPLNRPGASGAPPADGGRLVIGPGRHYMSFQFAGLSFTAPKKVRYRWKLEGVDADWNEGGETREAGYGLLPPGRYTFRVTACNNDGVWNPKGSAIDFEIQPHFWQTWWFKISTATAVLGLILLGLHRRHLHQLERLRHQQEIARQRLEHQQTLERERARIARDLHDDLGANLTSIALVADVGRKRKEHVEEVDAALAGVAATARESVREMDAIVWALNTRNDSLDHFASFLSHYAEDFFRPTDISCELKIPDDLPVLPLTNEARHGLFLAAKEALNNVARHAEATAVKLQLTCDDRRLKLTIADNGRGLPAAPPGSGQDGLRNLRDRLAMLGGEVNVETPSAGGTRLHLSVPLENIRSQ